MCDICHRVPCHSQCPNGDNTYNIIGECENCGLPISENYEYYKDGEGFYFCSRECVDKHYGIKNYD